MKTMTPLKIEGMQQRRWQVWHEAQRLSQGVQFTPEHGCFLRGEQVCILADVEPEEQEGRFRVGVTVFPLGQQPVDMSGFPVALTGQTESGVVYLYPGQTNHRGDVTFHQLPAAEYSLRFPLASGRSAEPLPEVRYTRREPAAQTTAREDLAALPLAAATETQEESTLPAPKVYPLLDGALLGTVRRTVGDSLEVAFETRRADWAGAKVWFAFVEPETHRLLLEKEVTLAETEEPGVWEGVWLSEPGFRLEAEGELVFEVVGSGS